MQDYIEEILEAQSLDYLDDEDGSLDECLDV